MTAEELQTLLREARPPVLLDVLPPESFAKRHLPGARNACVYETVFLGTLATLVPAKDTPLVVYGLGSDRLAAPTAREKLEAAGYSDVRVFRGGIDEWQRSGLPLEGDSEAPEPLTVGALSGTFALDPTRSVIFWTGRNLFNHHHGSVRLAEGTFQVSEGNFTAADFAVDVKSIACSDLVDPGYNSLLLGHLASNDFFDTAHHPTAVFHATSVEAIDDAPLGSPNYRLRGDLTLRGATHPLEFVAVCTVNEAGEFVAQAEIDLDRTTWGSLYGSGRFFEALGKHVVNDLVHLHIVLVAVKR
ncbi:YceI family protein [soil metagenome]